MQLEIKNTKTVKEISDEFNSLFPHLKLEFFHHSHNNGEGSGKGDMIGKNVKLGDIQTIKRNGVVVFNEVSTISDFERILKSEYGLNVQVFRKSRNLWIETTITDGWSLQKQEETGTEMDNSIN